ncbi:MAG: hypothetical protein U0031_18610 [Thermomicrobiales bacterium]
MLHNTARRTVLGGAAAALAAVPVLPALAKRHKKNTKAAFRLVTGCRADGGCSCHACEGHAANKLFATKSAVVRAHLHCNCRIDSVDLQKDLYAALFHPVGLPAVTAVDKRDPRIKEIFDAR